MAQERKISGTVMDETGDVLPGATIIVKGTSMGTTSNFDGAYTIKAEDKQILVFSFIGYETKEVKVSPNANYNVILNPDAHQLEDIVVVGYGTQKKANLTGALSTVDSKILENRPTTSLAQSLQGQVPGVTIVTKGGAPSITIRGRGTFGGAASPLFVIDGVMSTEGFFNSLDPNMVESITFLKDASSAAIYGAKAAYGVVLVTTKSGGGEPKVSYSGSYGFNTPTFMPDVVNSADYARLHRKSQLNSGFTEDQLRYSLHDVEMFANGTDRDMYPDTNWFDEILADNPIFTKHNLTLSGGSGDVKYIMGGGYLHNESIIPGGSSNRFNFNTKIDVKLTNWFDVTTNINYVNDKYNRTNGGASLTEFLRVPPTQTARQSNGNWGSVRDMREVTGEELNANQLRKLEEGGRSNSSTARLQGSINFRFKLMDGLTFSNLFSYNTYEYSSFSFANTMDAVESYINPGTYIVGSAMEPNEMHRSENYSNKLMYDGWFNYEKTFNKDHNISAVLGTHVDKEIYKTLNVGRIKFASNDMSAISGGSTDPKDQKPTTDYFSEETSLSFFGRVAYDYKSIYLLEANFRADGSSRFAEGNRWGYFPSFSAGWRISGEEFMEDYTWIDNLKLRASWGHNGNINNTGIYSSYSTFKAGNIYLGGDSAPVIWENTIADPTLTWENTVTTDIGLDFGVLNGLFGLTVDYYHRATNDILVSQTDVPVEEGIGAGQLPKKNAGQVVNTGIEIALSHFDTYGDFSYNIGVNASFMNNEITNLGGVDQMPPSSYWINKIGEAIGSFYMYEADGLYSQEDKDNGAIVPIGGVTGNIDAGSIKLVDQDGDGEITPEDRKVVGSDVPTFTYGVNLNLEYKGFNLSVMGQGVQGTSVYLDMEASQIFFNNSVPRNWQKDNWDTNNQDGKYPKLWDVSDPKYIYNTSTMSSFWLYSADYFRVKNITFGYSLPKSVLEKLKMDRVNFFISGDNMFTIMEETRRKDFDPERGSGRGSQLTMKTFTVGVNLSF